VPRDRAIYFTLFCSALDRYAALCFKVERGVSSDHHESSTVARTIHSPKDKR
jgi:hypothetical protein